MSNKRRQILEDEYAEFVASWQAERARWVDGYVPGRLLLVTGLTLRELEEAGYVESNGAGYKPR